MPAHRPGARTSTARKPRGPAWAAPAEPDPIAPDYSQQRTLGAGRARDDATLLATDLPPAAHSYQQAMALQLQRRYGNAAVRRMIRGGHGARPAAGGPARIQRFESYEHADLGDKAGGARSGYITLDCLDRDFPQRHADEKTWPKDWRDLVAQATGAMPAGHQGDVKRALREGFSYGELVALSGDLYADEKKLNDPAASFARINQAPLKELIRLLPLVRSHSATTDQFQEATGGRYLELAENNETHFSQASPGRNNHETWRNGHIAAIKAARRAKAGGAALANQAWGINAMSDHYLTDAFAGGHISTPRAELIREHGAKLGGVMSKFEHDLGNNYGVKVTNARGDAWTAYGDDHLADKDDDTNHKLALEAVQLSKQDVADALERGTAYPEPNERTHFAAEDLIPHPAPADPAPKGVLGKAEKKIRGVGSAILGGVRDVEEVGSLAIHELPGQIEGLWNDDDQIRAWVARQDSAALGRVPADDKIRMINVLLDGWVSEADLAAIRKLCASSTSSDQAAIRDAAGKRVHELWSKRQRRELRAILGIAE